MRDLALKEKLRSENPNPVYCRYCGREMDIVSAYSVGFDDKTGKPLYQIWYGCPKYKAWNPFTSSHLQAKNN